MTRAYTIALVDQTPPLSLNDRTHWATKARHTKRLRQHAWVHAVTDRIPPLAGATITLHYLPATRRRRDDGNLHATLKPCVDGLVDAGVVPDDSAEYVRTAVTIHPAEKGDRVRLWLTIEETPC